MNTGGYVAQRRSILLYEIILGRQYARGRAANALQVEEDRQFFSCMSMHACKTYANLDLVESNEMPRPLLWAWAGIVGLGKGRPFARLFSVV
jgi:hypothetical protein